MPVSAGSYKMERGFEGQVASNQYFTYIKGTLEGVVNGQDTILPFGRFVVAKLGGLPGEVQLPSAANQVILGVVPFADRFERDADGNTGYPAKQAAAYMQKGVIWMKAETAMTRGGAVFIRHTANTTPGDNEAVGRIRANIDTNKASRILNAYILEACAAGELVKVELNLPPLGELSTSA